MHLFNYVLIIVNTPKPINYISSLPLTVSEFRGGGLASSKALVSGQPRRVKKGRNIVLKVTLARFCAFCTKVLCYLLCNQYRLLTYIKTTALSPFPPTVHK